MSGIGFPNTANFAYTTIATAANVIATGTTSGAGVVAGSQGPTLNLNFQFSPAGGPVLDPRITFNRGTNATYTNSAGNVQLTAGVNDARFDYDPVTLACKGLLIEEARTNLLTYSEQFDNAAWSKTSLTVTANSVASPDGTTTADKLVEVAASAQHNVNEFPSTTNTNPLTISVFLKSAEKTSAYIILKESTTFARFSTVVFNLSAGTASAVTNNGGAGSASASVVVYPNGWYRCVLTTTLGGADAGVIATIGIGTSAGQTYTGDGTSGLYIWGAQLEAGAFPTSYIPTTTAAATRNADNAVMTGTNFSSWYNQTQGTFVVRSDQYAAGSTTGQFTALESGDGTNNNLIQIATQYGLNNYQALVINANVTQAIFLSPSDIISVKRALAYATNDFAISTAGGAAATNTSGTVPTVSSFGIGVRPSGFGQINGHIASIAYYPTRLPNATLQALTV